MSMIEMVARAIDPTAYKQWQSAYDYEMGITNDTEKAAGFADWAHPLDRVRASARAAIEALRDCTDEMDLAGGAAVDRTNPYDRDIAENVWRAMIDAALAEPAPGGSA